MKQGIHPEYTDCTITRICGNTWKTRSVRKELRIEHCNLCHPVFTGEDSVLVDTAGQVDKFERRVKAAEARKGTVLSKTKKRRKKKDDGEEDTEE